jgi:hypothetical protein
MHRPFFGLLAIALLCGPAQAELRSDLMLSMTWNDRDNLIEPDYSGSARFVLQSWEAATFGLNRNTLEELGRFIFPQERPDMLHVNRETDRQQVYETIRRANPGLDIEEVHVDIRIVEYAFVDSETTRDTREEPLINTGTESRPFTTGAAASGRYSVRYAPEVAARPSPDLAEQTTPRLTLRLDTGQAAQDIPFASYAFGRRSGVLDGTGGDALTIRLDPGQVALATVPFQRITYTVSVTLEKSLSGFVAVQYPRRVAGRFFHVVPVATLREAALAGRFVNGNATTTPFPAESWPEKVRETAEFTVTFDRPGPVRFAHFCALAPFDETTQAGTDFAPTWQGTLPTGACEGAMVTRLSSVPYLGPELLPDR